MKITKFSPHHPELLASGLTLGSPAGGDLSGSLPGPTVTGLQGTPVATTAPSVGQILYFDGTDWKPVALATEGTHASRPAAASGNTGWLYHESDANGELFISTGAAWDRVAAGSIAVVASGLTGATAASRYAGATTSGAPASGTFAKGDFIIDQTGKVYVCTTAGSPGSWTNAGSTFSLEVKEADGAPDVTGVSQIIVSNGTLTDNGGGSVSITTSGSSSLEVKEIDGAPDVTGVTVIQVSNGTLTDNGSGNVTITTTGGSGTTINYPGLKPGTPDADFADAATLATDGWTAHSSQGSFALSDCFKQSIDGSFLDMGYSAQMGAIYLSTTNVDQEWIVGGLRLQGDLTGATATMSGIAILDASGDGVGVLIYNDSHIYLAAITGWVYVSNYGNIAASNGIGMGHDVKPYQEWWLRLTRVGNTWDGYASMSGRAWDFHMSATGSRTITADKKCIGMFYNTGTAYTGRLMADWVDTP